MILQIWVDDGFSIYQYTKYGFSNFEDAVKWWQGNGLPQVKWWIR